MQKPLETLGGRDLLKDGLLALGVELRIGACGFQPLLNPALLGWIHHIHKFGAHLAAVRLFERLENFSKRHLLLAEIEVVCTKDGVEVGVGEVVEGGLELRDAGPLAQLEGVEVCPLVAKISVGRNQ